MSMNKENVRPKKVREVKGDDPFQRVLSKNESQNVDTRDPLKNLNCNVEQNSLAGPSQSSKTSETHPHQLDTKYVTFTRGSNNGDLDWNLEVFRDIFYDATNRHTQSGASYNSLTPTVSPPIQKKVKRSLKRPSSFGIKENSSVAASTPISPLRNIEAKVSHLGTTDLQLNPLNEHYAVDNLIYLLEIEKKGDASPAVRTVSRSCVINWIITLHSSKNSPIVVQLACWYLDRYLSSNWVSISKLQLIAAACYWIATKFYGGYISCRKLVKYSGAAFDEMDLVAAEKNVLRKLSFELQGVVPHDFVPYLSWWCCSGRCDAGDVEAAATFLCQCGLVVDKHLSKEYPSVVAVAAVKIALVLLDKRSFDINLLENCPIFQAAQKKASNMSKICDQLYAAIEQVKSPDYLYKAVICKYSIPPLYITDKIFRN